ncbi:hypothetical protein [Colwellia psychrerythraea]|uniref:Uncharacterized protein n=1 Tax=Colwellia psychrerythraea TaxID=28229 RepID=A0A099L6Z2_COLPS|nr:hypothetical protein [Colwellia psychrerythraea]KGJ97633.1 hypothetical protein GAB14E_1222 [Colwellia psychrerythraea]
MVNPIQKFIIDFKKVIYEISSDMKRNSYELVLARASYLINDRGNTHARLYDSEIIDYDEIAVDLINSIGAWQKTLSVDNKVTQNIHIQNACKSICRHIKYAVDCYDEDMENIIDFGMEIDNIQPEYSLELLEYCGLFDIFYQEENFRWYYFYGIKTSNLKRKYLGLMAYMARQKPVTFAQAIKKVHLQDQDHFSIGLAQVGIYDLLFLDEKINHKYRELKHNKKLDLIYKFRVLSRYIDKHLSGLNNEFQKKWELATMDNGSVELMSEDVFL